jgi:DNA-binding IclR family transcriptional regulator
LPQSAGLRRDLEVLRELASEESLRRGGLGVVRIAERLGREKSQVSRALRALEAEGMVERDPRTRTYQLGWALYTLAARGVETRLVRAAATWLRGLAEDTGRTVRLCVLIGGQVLTLAVVAPGQTLYQDGSAEAGVAVTDTAAGPALLLDWPPDSLEQLGAAEDLGERVDRVRSRGYVVHHDRSSAGRSGVAAPVRDFRGIVLAAVELASPDAPPDGAVEAEPVPDLIAAVRAAAAGLSGDLGHESRVPARR